MRVENIPYGKVQTGEVSGSATAKQLPSIECSLVMIIAVGSNSGNVYLGGSGVTVVNTTTDTTSGYELKASAQTPWIPVNNLNLLYIICDNAGDDITYFALS
jgi:hypothetical protein